jgi:uncharacterized membrane protein YfcA
MEHGLILTALALLGTGFFAGILGALLGIGGGVIVVPFLVLVMRLPIRIAIGTSFVAVLAVSLSSASSYLEKGLCDIETGIALEAATVPGAAAGAYLAGVVNQHALQVAFSLILFYVSLSMLLKGPGKTLGKMENDRRKEEPLSRFAYAASFLAGIISGSLGVGGGIIKVPILYKVLDFPIKEAIATSSYMIGITVATGTLVFAIRGDVDPSAASLLVAGIFLGARGGTRMMPRFPEKTLRTAFAFLLLYFGIRFLMMGVW